MGHGEETAHTCLDHFHVVFFQEHAQSADQSLNENQDHGHGCQPAQPAALFRAPDRDCDDQRDDRHEARAEAVRMLGEHGDVTEPAFRIERTIG